MYIRSIVSPHTLDREPPPWCATDIEVNYFHFFSLPRLPDRRILHTYNEKFCRRITITSDDRTSVRTCLCISTWNKFLLKLSDNIYHLEKPLWLSFSCPLSFSHGRRHDHPPICHHCVPSHYGLPTQTVCERERELSISLVIYTYTLVYRCLTLILIQRALHFLLEMSYCMFGWQSRCGHMVLRSIRQPTALECFTF